MADAWSLRYSSSLYVKVVRLIKVLAVFAHQEYPMMPELTGW